VNINELAPAILAGDFDNDIDKIYTLLKDRSKLVRAIQSATVKSQLRPGSHCTITNIRPKSLNGVEVEVINIKDTTATVKLVNQSDGWRNGRFGTMPFGCPMSCLIPLEKKDALSAS
jgi:hypothetical protein